MWQSRPVYTVDMDFDPEKAYYTLRLILVLAPVGAGIWAFFSKNSFGEFDFSKG